MITGCTVFFVLAILHHGGWRQIIGRVQEIRPLGRVQTPPTPSIWAKGAIFREKGRVTCGKWRVTFLR